MTASTLEAVLRRDRLIVVGALGVMAALAWSYVIWLANDMDMGGMDMTGFRMIPAGMGAPIARIITGKNCARRRSAPRGPRIRLRTQ